VTFYDIFANFYERHWGRAFLSESIQLFQRHLADQMQAGDPVLELCCGTGYFSQWLAKQGYEVTGIDNSEAMLPYGSRRLPAAQLLQSDARNFCLPDRFGALVSFFNSLNQFLDPCSLRAVLTSVYRHLKPGGWFLFDTVLEHGYVCFWEGDECIRHRDHTCELRYRFDERTGLASCFVAISNKDVPSSRRSQFVLHERPHSIPLIKEEVSQTGFELVSVTPVPAGMPPEGRVAVLARRPIRPPRVSKFLGERNIDDD
jgi:ubiquinone/menaquinone biosynthesis C-methylase UbiE